MKTVALPRRDPDLVLQSTSPSSQTEAIQSTKRISKDDYQSKPLTPGQASAVIAGATPEQNERASRFADLIFEALNGGVWGIGVDKPRLFAALELMEQGGSADLARAHYRAHYGLDLEQDLLGQVKGPSKVRASSILLDEATKADAVALKQALSGLFPDKSTAFQILERAAQTGQSKQLSEALAELFPGEGLRLDRLPWFELSRADALLKGDLLGAQAHHVVSLLDQERPGKIRDAVLTRVLREGGAALAQRYTEVRQAADGSGADLEATLKDRIQDPLLLTQALAALHGDEITLRAVAIGRTLRDQSGFQALDVVEAMLSGTDKPQREAIRKKYQEIFGVEVQADGKERRPAIEQALSEALSIGTLSIPSRIQATLRDPAALIATLESAGPLAPAAVEAFQKRTGKSLAESVEGLDNLDQLRLGFAMTGPPKSLEEAMDRLREERDLLRAGAANTISRGTIDFLLLSRVKRVDETVARAEAALKAAKKDGSITDAEAAHITTLIRYGETDVSAYRDAVNRVARVTKNLAGTVAAGTALATTGTGSSVVLKAAAAALASGTAMSVTDMVLTGRNYTLERLRSDFGVGALTGASLYAAQGMVKEMMHVGAEVIGGATGLVLQVPGPELTETYRMVAADWVLNSYPMMQAAAALTEGTARGAIGFGMTDAIRKAYDAGTWEEGTRAALDQIAHQAVEGLKVGAFNGALGALVGMAIGGIQRVSMLPDDLAKSMIHPIKVDTPSGPQSLEVIGPADAHQLRDIMKGLQKLSDTTEGAGVRGLEYVYIMNTEHGIYGGIAIGHDAMVLNMDSKWSPDHHWSSLGAHGAQQTNALEDTIFHERGHVAHNQLFMEQNPHTPMLPTLLHGAVGKGGLLHEWLGEAGFGKPPFLTDYARTNAFEDVAETHEAMIRSLFQTGEIQIEKELLPKVEWLLKNFYPDLKPSISVY
ncbi:MAG: hypothetical protein U1E65_01665 [Myxococcota bacterium]